MNITVILKIIWFSMIAFFPLWFGIIGYIYLWANGLLSEEEKLWHTKK